MKRIRITRDSFGDVRFETVSVDTTENVFFINLDTQAEHHPTICEDKLGPAPSAPSGQCDPNPGGQNPPATYGCSIPGHEAEVGIINIFPAMSQTTKKLLNATAGQAIPRQQLVRDGMSPYTITNEVFEINDSAGGVIDSGAGIGPGLQLIPTTNNSGVSVEGTPTVAGTYKFSFEVDDGLGGNLQQLQYRMLVS